MLLFTVILTMHMTTYIALSHNFTYKISNPHGVYFTIRLNK